MARARGSLDAATVAALEEALDDEYKAAATYHAVIAAFGPVRPFINIVEAEQRHAAALLALFERHGLTPPPDRWAGSVAAPESLEAACREAVAGEIENAAMYDRLLGAVGDSDVAQVLTRLREASQERHLPAFRRGLARAAGLAPGQGHRHGEDGGEERGRGRQRRHRGGRGCPGEG